MFKHYPHIFLKSTPSTNTLASQWVGQGQSDFVVQTLSQTQGRGRQGRVWHNIQEQMNEDTRGNLFLTVSFNLSGDLQNALSFYPFFWGIVVYDVIAQYLGLETAKSHLTLKWPNDVMISGKKVSGILIETAHYKGQTHLIVGIGMNINETPASIGQLATCLTEVLPDGNSINPFSVARRILTTADQLFLLFQNDALSLYSEWQRRCLLIGIRIKVRQQKTFVDGIMKGLSPEGYLKLLLDTGHIQEFHSVDEIIESK